MPVLGAFKKISTADVRIIKKCVPSGRVRQLTVCAWQLQRDASGIKGVIIALQ